MHDVRVVVMDEDSQVEESRTVTKKTTDAVDSGESIVDYGSCDHG
jgi:hypothetical protein